MSTQITIEETGAPAVTRVAEGVPGGDGLPGQGITGRALLVPDGANPTVTASPNTLHLIDVVNTAVTLLLPAGTATGTQVAVIRHNSNPGPLTDFVEIQADTDAGASLHGDPVTLYGDGEAATFFHVGGNAWWLMGTGDLPAWDGNVPNSVVRRDNAGRIQAPDPADDGDVANRGWVSRQNGVGLRVDGYIGHNPPTPIGTSSTLIFGNPLSITADGGSFIPTRDCVVEFELDVHLTATSGSAGQFRLDYLHPDNTVESIVNTKRFHFHGDVGTKIFRVRGVARAYQGARIWFLLYAGVDAGVTGTTCPEVDYQYVERT